MIPTVSSRADGYAAARRRAGIVDRSDRAHLVVSGNDRRSYLHGLLTNDVTALQAGQGCYAAYLTPQGRMIADLWVYELGDVILLSLARDLKATVLTRLEQLIFAEDVQLGDIADTFACVAVVGPESARVAASVLTGASIEVLAALPEHGNLRTHFQEQPVIALRVTDPGEPGYDILVDRSLQGALKAALGANGAVDVDLSTAEALRIEAGMPRFHRDMDETTIPLEAGIESKAISFTKGCYVGQEVIIRVLHRGHGRIARKLVGLTLDGDGAPPPGAAVRVDAREVGHVTSSALSPALKRPIALAYVHRDFVASGANVTVEGSSAVVTQLPFVERQV